MRTGFIFLGLLVGLLISRFAEAELVSSINVPDLIQGADLIVVGRITSLTAIPVPQWSTSGSGVRIVETADVSVSRVLKGTLRGNSHFVRLSRGPGAGVTGIEVRQFGIFFLKWGDSNAYSVTDDDHPVLVASPTFRPGNMDSADPRMLVARELAGVLATPPTELTDPYSGVRHLGAIQGARSPLTYAERAYGDASGALIQLPGDITRPFLETVAASSQELSRVWAIICLVDLGETSNLPAIESFLLKPPEDLPATTSAIAGAIGRRGNPLAPDAIPLLSRLLGSTSTRVREAAATDLAYMPTPDVIAPLASVALKDPDPDVRFQAEIGLCRVTGRQAAPCKVRFDEATQFSYWTQWAAANGIK